MFICKSCRFLFAFIFFLSPFFLKAQQTQIYVDADAQYRSALDLFEKQKYSEAEDAFDKIVSTSKDKNNLFTVDAEYYAALCAMELFHKDAETRLKQFLADYPESPKCRQVYFQLGRYNFRKKDYKDALVWFHQVEIYDLQKDELSEYYFKRGYAHYELNQVDSAKTDFFEIKDGDSKYSPAANYYYSHIAYTEGNYETALQGFQKLSGDETFGSVVPYYIAQIYFFQKRYADVISYAPPLLDSAKRAPEIAQLIGASYYRLGKYRDAIPFLEKHHAGSNTFTRDDAYELGYAYYKSDSCAHAVEFFQQAISDSSDALAQNSWYHLADCFLKTNDKLQARNSFLKAAGMKFDPVIREDALFNSARLSYELDFSPFNEAIVSLNEYLKEFPNTPRHDEAYTLLTNVYLSSKKYKEALASLEQLKVMTLVMEPTYQKIAFNYGIDLYNQKDYDGAMANFNKALIYPMNRELNSQAHYWQAECWYANAGAKKDTTLYQKAIDEYQSFQVTPGATILPNYNTANYNIGYCYFLMQKMTQAMIAFRKYIANKSASDSDDKVFDAYLRMGDGYFSMKDYVNSADFYGKAQSVQTKDDHLKDYAMYQQALALGYQGKKQEKADLLKKFHETFPKSEYLSKSRYAEARTLHDLRSYDQALDAYTSLYNDYPTGDYAVPCLKNMGLIYRAKNDPDDAMTQFKKAVSLVKNAKGSDYADLLREIKEIYVGKGQLDQWEAYATSIGYSETQSVADSTTYVVAEKFYSDGNCTDAMKEFNKYISKYPAGIYITEINFMRAECSYKNNDLNTALGSYIAVLDKGESKYTERCLIQTSVIYYKQKDYPDATKMYLRLENESTNQDVQNNLDSASLYAAKVVTILRLTNDIYGQAHYLLGKSAIAKNDKTTAEKEFKDCEKAVPNTKYAAEARYELCWMQYDSKQYKPAEKALLKEINDYAGFSEWSGKGWLLLADDYLAMKDTFQAKFVLKNYIDNGDVPELQKEAQAKLDAIEAAQKPGTQKKEEDIVVPMGGSSNDNKLYDNEPVKQGGGQ